jgi:hypothetical protein
VYEPLGKGSVLSVGCKVTDTLTASASLLVPAYTRSFSAEDVLEPAPVISISVAREF